jgi:hypothetical protein
MRHDLTILENQDQRVYMHSEENRQYTFNLTFTVYNEFEKNSYFKVLQSLMGGDSVVIVHRDKASPELMKALQEFVTAWEAKEQA